MLNAKNFGLAGGIIFAAIMLLGTWIAVGTGYLGGFYTLFTGLYPGYTVTWVGGIIGGIYGFIDMFIGCYLFAWLYNKLEKKK